MRKVSMIYFCIFTTIVCKAQWDEVCSKGNGFVDNFAVYEGKLYATGFFTKICDLDSDYLVSYDGNDIQSLPNGFPAAGHKLAIIEDTLYGAIYQPIIDSNWVYKYDGQSFKKMLPGVYLSNAVAGFSQTANLYNIIQYNNNIIACGEFDKVGKNKISGIMQRKDGDWVGLGTGLSGNITGTAPVMYPHDMCIYENDLIVCGNFKNAGGKLANGIARWNGSEWQSLGAGFNSTVYAAFVYKGELYAGGDFTKSGTKDLKYIAKWNGQEWINPGFTLYYQNSNDYTFIHTITEIKGRLIISGGFDRASMSGKVMKCGSIASFDGTTIDTLMGGLKGREVEAVALYNNKLYAGGGTYANSYIASYDLTTAVVEESNDTALSIHPNPSTGTLSVINTTDIEEVWLTNINGHTILKQKGPSRSLQIEIEQAGSYILHVKSSARVTHHKVVIAK